jgi:small subunit ribosomal protein S6
MPFYESVFIARQDISSEQAESLTEEFTKVIDGLGGKVTKKEYWGLRTLAYKIRKNRKGHYMLLNIDAPPPAIPELERQMRLNEDILRYLTIKVDALEEEPSIVMQRGSARDDRPGRDRGDRGDRGDRSSRPPRRDDEGREAVAPPSDKVSEGEGE